jgi:hypothetical protein
MKETDFNVNLNGIMVVELLMLKLLRTVLSEVQQDLQVTLIVIANPQVEHDHLRELKEKIEIYDHVMTFRENGHHIKISKGIVIEYLDNVKICLIEIVI